MKLKNLLTNTYYSLFKFILLFAFASFTSSYSQTSDIKFEHLTPEMGLSQATVHCILQDSKGFLWFGTEDGLNRYDGYNFTIYRHIEVDTNSISDNFIWSLFEDSDGILWIGTSNGGLNKFDREKQIFKQYQNQPGNLLSLSQDDVRTIYEDNSGNLWIGTNNGGLNKFNKTDETFIRYKNISSDENSISSNSIRDIVEDESGNLWIGTNGGGLNKFDPINETFRRIAADRTGSKGMNNNFIWSLLRDDNGIIWIGTNGGGLSKLDPAESSFNNFINDPDSKNSLVNNNITSLYKDEKGLLWIGTEGGLSIFDEKNQKFTNIKYDPLRPSSLSNNFIRFITEDRSGLIWIGTVGGGINKYNRSSKKFVHYQHDPSDPNSLSSNMIRAVFEDQTGILWVGTLGGGLNRFDRNKKSFSHYKHDDDDGSISDNRITSIYEDSKRNLWVGTWGGGLNKFPASARPSHNGFIHYKHNSGNRFTVLSDTIQAIYEDSFRNLWVGTEAGLSVFSEEENGFISFRHNSDDPGTLSDDRVQSKCIYEDAGNNLWIGTWNGLNRISNLTEINSSNAKEISFKTYVSNPAKTNTLSDNRIISIYEDPSSSKDTIVLWIGTVSGGLNKMVISSEKKGRPENLEIVHFTEKNGLPNNAIYGILGDERGNLWLSTNNGLSKFNPVDESFRNYYESDGLQSNQFYWGASFKSSSGEMFFGGINGLTAFYPSDLKDNRHVPEVYITDFQLFNKPVPISEESPLNKSILVTERIELPYDSYVMTFEFVALDYTTPEKNQYAYMLEGYDKDWIPAGNRRFVTYSGIGPGEYMFRVRGSNNDGIWNLNGAAVALYVDSPFWMTWWFLSLAIILITVLVVYFVTSQIKQLLAVERLRTKLAADLHDNIGASLTEISILSEVISKKLKDEEGGVQKNLKRISEDSRGLIDKMSDIVWLVNPRRDTLYDLILRLEDTYSELLSLTNISFTSKNLKSLEKISLSMEHRQHLYLIFKEGINNSITHSNCSEITLDAHVNNKHLEMILTDNGEGFEVDHDYLGNGLSNMKDRAKQIGGKLIIDSEKGKGTRIEFHGKIK